MDARPFGGPRAAAAMGCGMDIPFSSPALALSHWLCCSGDWQTQALVRADDQVACSATGAVEALSSMRKRRRRGRRGWWSSMR
eukprot:565958-Pyramimonas_sp.AAC.1